MCITTLSSDIGESDFIIGAFKGQLLTSAPDLTIVDVNHQLSTSNYPQSAYICSNAFKYFPENTIHVVLIDLFAHKPNCILVAYCNGHYIICPDNGILTMIANEKPEKIVKIAVPESLELNTIAITQTIAGVVSQLHKGALLADLGEYNADIQEKYPLRPTVGANWIEGQIIFIDHFENVVINISKEEFEEHRKDREFNVQFTRTERISAIGENYSSVSVSDIVAWFNSAGYLEIAINKGNVAGLFGMQRFGEQNDNGINQITNYFYKTVRIYFEESQAPVAARAQQVMVQAV